MSRVLPVFIKEVVDNFRDRRTLFSAIVLGPLFGPAMFALMVGLIVDRTVNQSEEILELPIAGAEHAPNLVAFLEQNRVSVLPAPDEPEQAVRAGRIEVALVVPEDFSTRFLAGEPARVQVISDQSNNRNAAKVARARNLLHGYSRQIGSLRLQARGINPAVTQPLVVEDFDVSTPAGRSVLVLGMMTYFFLFSVLMGGMYLAIDTTAGERERGSLEPLLTLPVRRGELIVGKIAAACFYMLLSLVVTVTVFTVVLGYVPLEKLGMSTRFGAREAVATVAVMLPFILVGAGLMTVVASFTRSYKEAQTWLSVILLVPTLPILFAGLQSLKPSLALMTVPSLSQHLLITQIIRNEPLDIGWALVSAASSLLLGVALVLLAVRLYRRESLLG